MTCGPWGWAKTQERKKKKFEKRVWGCEGRRDEAQRGGAKLL